MSDLTPPNTIRVEIIREDEVRAAAERKMPCTARNQMTVEYKINQKAPKVVSPPSRITPETHWACSCVRRDRAGKIKAIKLHPMTTKSCRVCGSKQFIGKILKP